MKKLRQFHYLAYFILISLFFTKKVDSAEPRIGRGDTINLICSGTVTDVTAAISDAPVSGVYVVIAGNIVTIFNVPTFPDYQAGMAFDVQSRNPSKIWTRNQKVPSIASTINRMTGDIYIEEIAPSKDRMLRWFHGTCTNAKPVF